MGSEDIGRKAETGWRGKVETQVKSTSLLLFVLLAFAAFGLFLYLAERQTVYEVSDALIAGLAVVSFMRFAPAGWNAIKLPVHKLDSGEFLLVGMTCLRKPGIRPFR